MIPEHDGDSWLKYQTQVTSKGGPKNRGIVRNVHHDRANGKEGRVLTLPADGVAESPYDRDSRSA